MGNTQSNSDNGSNGSNGANGSPGTLKDGAGGSRTGSDAKHYSHSHASRKAGNPPPTHLVSIGSPSTTLTPTHARARSITTTPKLRHQDSISHSRSDSPAYAYASAMGNAESKSSPHHRPPSRSSPLPIHSTPPHRSNATPEPRLPASPHAHAVRVPPAVRDAPSGENDYVPSAYADSPFGLPASNYSRPPRLPLPIEEEVHAPGSPIITPHDISKSSPLDQTEAEGTLPRKSSVLSSTTIDDDDLGDTEAFAPTDSASLQVRVPTRLEWHGPGEKIFVTGTFCNWEKKMKLHRQKDHDGFAATVLLPPGTHHVKFLVDGEMMTSNGLPTTVEWANILVNYVEIVAPLPVDEEDEAMKQIPVPAEPMPIPGAAMTAGQGTGTAEPAARPLSYRTEARAPETEADISSTYDDNVGPKGETLGSPPPPATAPISATPGVADQAQPQPERKATAGLPIPKLPRPKYNNQIPPFLIDMDNYNNPEDERYQRAQRLAATLPQPPSLPMFLSKSILNGATPHKDDASVLIMPNHTVLNHLATSSIKSGVLATSGTTRYKRKFLTTIMYKPTSEDG